MKQIRNIVAGAGLFLFGLAGSCDFTEHPIIAIPLIIGVVLILLGYEIEKNWCFDEEDDFELCSNRKDEIDSGIVYIEYDERGAERMRVKK